MATKAKTKVASAPASTKKAGTEPAPKAVPPLIAFATKEAFETYMDNNHMTTPEVQIKLAKKAAQIPSITLAEAVEVVLCFGWIDGGGKTIDEKWWMTRFVPRRPKSVWSKKNVETVERLTAEGRMRQKGLELVEQAKRDGRWARAYAGPSTITVPKDFEERLNRYSSTDGSSTAPIQPVSRSSSHSDDVEEETKEKEDREKTNAAKSFFQNLSKSHRYNVLVRIEMAASDKSRISRIESSIEMLAQGRVPGVSAAKTTTKTKTNPTKKADKAVSSVAVMTKKKKRIRAIETEDHNDKSQSVQDAKLTNSNILHKTEQTSNNPVDEIPKKRQRTMSKLENEQPSTRRQSLRSGLQSRP